MADVHSKKIRSYNMSKIKGKNTRPEIMVRKFLFSHGFRYRLNVKKLSGKPDIVLSKYRIVIFINGCFWHGHEGCKYFVVPKTRTEWWIDKIQKNKERDFKCEEELLGQNWRVITIWECELKPDKRAQTLEQVLYSIKESMCHNAET